MLWGVPCPPRFCSSGLGSKRSIWLGPPFCMKWTIARARAGGRGDPALPGRQAGRGQPADAEAGGAQEVSAREGSGGVHEIPLFSSPLPPGGRGAGGEGVLSPLSPEGRGELVSRRIGT